MRKMCLLKSGSNDFNALDPKSPTPELPKYLEWVAYVVFYLLTVI